MNKISLECKNCNTQNPLYSLNCKNCNSYLRAKIPNIDFWNTVWEILYEPTNTFIKIIQAEKKNYLLTLTILLLIRFATLIFIINNYKNQSINYSENFINSFISGVGIILTTLIFSILYWFIIKLLKYNSRIKDNYSVLVFAFIPSILSFLFLIPFQFALFGIYWFVVNPLPILIKPFAAYVLYIIEVIFLLWSFLLIFKGINTQTQNKILSFLFFITYFLIIFFIIY